MLSSFLRRVVYACMHLHMSNGIYIRIYACMMYTQTHPQAHTHTHNILSLPPSLPPSLSLPPSSPSPPPFPPPLPLPLPLPLSLSDRFRLKSIMSRGRHQSSRSGASVIQTTYELIRHSEKTPDRSLSCLRHVEQNHNKKHACIYSQLCAMFLKFCACVENEVGK